MEKKVFPNCERDARMVEIYKDFIPKKVFDVHTHAYCAEDIPHFLGPYGVFQRERSGYWEHSEAMRFFLPGAEEIRINMMPMLDKVMNDLENGKREHANQFVYDELSRNPGNMGAPYILPCDTEEDIAGMIAHPGVRAIKVYCYGASPREDYDTCEVSEVLPEAAWVVSAQAGLPIVVHMMKPKALSDAENLRYITTMAKRYPDARLILAHCARSFASWTVVESIDKLAGLDNIWFDMAAICEPTPMAACILRTAGERVMWASDYPICMHRGKAFSLSDGFLWLTEQPLEKLGMEMGYLAGENLLAFYETAKLLNLDQTQVNRIFYDNAMDLFGVK